MAADVSQLTIVHYPAPVLRAKAKPIGRITEKVRSLAERMLQLMHEAPGVGLAAPQVGVSWRMFVANPTGDPADDQVFINPVLTEPSREMHDRDEGCLSLPDITAQIRRPKAITITATGLDGREFSLSSDELAARIWQHEIDHLDGVLIIDRMTPMDRLANARKLKELEKGMTR
ncbi:MAG: peptide deformylase [Phycisphaeraceae bacterium]